jgi:hypothetical protein
MQAQESKPSVHEVHFQQALKEVLEAVASKLALHRELWGCIM